MRSPRCGVVLRAIAAFGLMGLFLGTGASSSDRGLVFLRPDRANHHVVESVMSATPNLVVPDTPMQLPESAVLLAAHVRDVTAQNAKLQTRRGELTKQIELSASQRDAALAHVQSIKIQQKELRDSFERTAAAAYQYSRTPEVLDLTDLHVAEERAHSQVMISKVFDQAGRDIAAAEHDLSVARADAGDADSHYRSVVALNNGLDRRIAWVATAADWVRQRVAPHPNVPVLPESDLTVGVFEVAMAATRTAQCDTAWWLVAASANPVDVASNPRSAMSAAARWVCSESVTTPEAIGAGASGNLDPAVSADRARRWKELGFPDRPYGSVLVVGDSLGEGMRLAGLSKKLSAAGFSSTINVRVGRPTTEALSVLRANAKNHYALVVVETGTNDGGNSESYRKAIETTLKLYDVPILWIPPHLKRFDNFDRVAQEYAASEPRLHIVDWDPALAAHPAWIGGDGIHLTMTGYAAMADLTVASVTAAG